MAEDPKPRGKDVFGAILKGQLADYAKAVPASPEVAAELRDLIDSMEVVVAQFRMDGMADVILEDIEAAFKAAKLGHKEEVDALRVQYPHLNILAGLDKIVALASGAK